MSKKKSVVNSRNSGERTFGHGGQSPKDLGPVGNNQQKPGRDPVSLRPANADKDFDTGQHGESKEK